MFEKLGAAIRGLLNTDTPSSTGVGGQFAHPHLEGLASPGSGLERREPFPKSILAEMQVCVDRLTRCSAGYETGVAVEMQKAVTSLAWSQPEGWNRALAVTIYDAGTSARIGRHAVDVTDPVSWGSQKGVTERAKLRENLSDLIEHIEKLDHPRAVETAALFRSLLSKQDTERTRWLGDFEKHTGKPFVPATDHD